MKAQYYLWSRWKGMKWVLDPGSNYDTLEAARRDAQYWLDMAAPKELSVRVKHRKKTVWAHE